MRVVALRCVAVVFAVAPSACRRITAVGEQQMNQFLGNFSNAIHHRCVRSPRTQPPRWRVVVLDVGSNDGRFSDQLVPWLRQQHACLRQGVVQLHLVLVEPQPKFHNRLNKLTSRLGGTLLPYAAWMTNTTLGFQRSRNSAEAHVTAVTVQSEGGGAQKIAADVVPAIDFADFLLRTLQDGDLVLFKLDVEVGKRPCGMLEATLLVIRARGCTAGFLEMHYARRWRTRSLTCSHLRAQGAEYQLLPYLLAQGAMCRGEQHLLVEWHLHRISAEHQLGGLGLKLGLRALLEHGCKRNAPVSLLQEEFRPLNLGRPVPGLLPETMRHMENGTIEGDLGRLGVNYSIVVRAMTPRHWATFINGQRR